MINWRLRSYSQEEFVEAWESSTYYSEVLDKLNLNKSGGSLRIIKDTAQELDLSFISFYTNVSKKRVKAFSLEEILVNPSPYKDNRRLKSQLYAAGLKEERCEKCGLDEWLGEPLLLTLDHIDGNNRNNCLENLKILCPNCHSQTPTWCGKNKDRQHHPSRVTKIYCGCGKEIEKQNSTCRECYSIKNHEIKEYPPLSDMIAGVEKLGMKPYANTLGISDNGLRKVLRRKGVSPLPKKLR